MGLSVGIAIIAIMVARYFYHSKPEIPDAIEQSLKPLHGLLYNKWYVDEIYDFLFVNGLGKGGGRLLQRVRPQRGRWRRERRRLAYALQLEVSDLVGHLDRRRRGAVQLVLREDAFLPGVHPANRPRAGLRAVRGVRRARVLRLLHGALTWTSTYSASSYLRRWPDSWSCFAASPRSNKDLIRVWANLVGFAGFLISLAAAAPLPERRARASSSKSALDWIPALGAHYHLGIDGISLLLIMLTTLMGFLAILCSWSAIQDRVKEYYAMFLLLQTGMLGVFMALDFFLFYVFWELVLVPMYFIIGIWGGPRKLYAAIKFFLYTLAGSVLMLLGILTLYFQHYSQFHFYSFEIADLMRVQPAARDAADRLLGLLHRLRDQGPDVPVPHLAARRPRRSPHGWLRDPGRRAPEDGDLRLPPLLAAAAAASVRRPERSCRFSRSSRSSGSSTARSSA